MQQPQTKEEISSTLPWTGQVSPGRSSTIPAPLHSCKRPFLKYSLMPSSEGCLYASVFYCLLTVKVCNSYIKEEVSFDVCVHGSKALI